MRNKLRDHFYTQAAFSGLGLAFSAIMLAMGKEPSIYLPIITSILFAWLPSPLPGAASPPMSPPSAETGKAVLPQVVHSDANAMKLGVINNPLYDVDNIDNV